MYKFNFTKETKHYYAFNIYKDFSLDYPITISFLLEWN